ncbi:carbohydrate ABC transporter substrate-binding protein (CUT1 family) [Melghiribacillus thermohalophilus]|uniref:Carbohydrate ABC transporter substrate-binding protein (CUT1 family) n=1 Tax=Melghiribacillus thermohalophilus TaxID=1324956 RepID=A0A4V2V1T7_9BACI|nr:extracellular solute-binding protein [Melghiribacillus thermohalophilus]TCT22452.1 carbohydrate ABC transporter substrate-binding protein (CUT1 family) [Melghiribacillus thermohalophilus]
MKKSISFLFLFLFLLGLLAACGPSRDTVKDSGADEQNPTASEGEQESSAEGDKPEKLVVWINDEESQKKALEDIFAKYEEKTGIQIETVPMSMLDQVEAISLDGPAGRGPDVYFQPHDRIGDLVLRSLAEPVDLSDVREQYVETAINAVTYDGKIWGVPSVVETYGVIYNKKLVDRAPETIDDLMAIAEEYTNPEKDEYGFLMEAANFYFAYPFFKTYGGYVFHKEGSTYDIEDIGLANEGAVKGGELIQSWFKNGYIPVEINPDIMNGLFLDEKAAVVLTGPWALPDYKEKLGDNLGTSVLPKIEGEVAESFVGVKSWILSPYSEHKTWAVDLMKFVTNEENSLQYFEVAGEMPANQAALNSNTVQNDELIKAFAEQVQYGDPMPSAPEIQQVWEPINNALSFIANGEPVEPTLQEAVNLIKENIQAAKQ